MKVLKLITLTFVFAFSSLAFGQTVRDQIRNLDVDLQIRANEDPQFDLYLQEKQYQLQLERQAAVSSKERKIRERDHYNKIRKNFAIQNEKRKQLQEKRQIVLRNAHEKRQAQIIAREDRDRKKYAALQIKQRDAERARREALIARMQSRLSRFPASLAEPARPRISKESREKLYKKVLSDKRNSRRR